MPCGQHAVQGPAFEGPEHGRRRQALGVLDVLDIGHHHAVEGVADLRDVVGLTAVGPRQAGDPLGRQGVADREELGQVERGVFGGDDHEIEGPLGQEVHHRRVDRVLEERPVDRFALDQLIFEGLAVHRWFLAVGVLGAGGQARNFRAHCTGSRRLRVARTPPRRPGAGGPGARRRSAG